MGFYAGKFQSRVLYMSCEITSISLPVDVDVHKRDIADFTQVLSCFPLIFAFQSNFFFYAGSL